MRSTSVFGCSFFQTFQVVCGAPNVRPGLKIPFATLGAELPGDFKIKKAKLRGVESNGMLCSQAELQVGEGAEERDGDRGPARPRRHG